MISIFYIILIERNALFFFKLNTDYDLSQHQKYSGVSQEYLDQDDNTKYIPYVIEPSVRDAIPHNSPHPNGNLYSISVVALL